MRLASVCSIESKRGGAPGTNGLLYIESGVPPRHPQASPAAAHRYPRGAVRQAASLAGDPSISMSSESRSLALARLGERRELPHGNGPRSGGRRRHGGRRPHRLHAADVGLISGRLGVRQQPSERRRLSDARSRCRRSGRYLTFQRSWPVQPRRAATRAVANHPRDQDWPSR